MFLFFILAKSDSNKSGRKKETSWKEAFKKEKQVKKNTKGNKTIQKP